VLAAMLVSLAVAVTGSAFVTVPIGHW
jgi:hypothetical protein